MLITKNPGSDTRFTAIPNVEDTTSRIKMISGERMETGEAPTLRLEVRFKTESGVTAERIAEQLERKNAQAPDSDAPVTVNAINPSGFSAKRNSLTFDVTNVDSVRDLLTWLGEQDHLRLSVSEQKAFCGMCAEVGGLADGLAASEALDPKTAAKLVCDRVASIQQNVLRL
jgi:hypothetical protein